MKNIIKIAILLAVLFAGIQPASACWFEDPDPERIDYLRWQDPPFYDPETGIRSSISYIKQVFYSLDPETGATIVTTDIKKTKYIDYGDGTKSMEETKTIKKVLTLPSHQFYDPETGITRIETITVTITTEWIITGYSETLISTKMEKYTKVEWIYDDQSSLTETAVAVENTLIDPETGVETTTTGTVTETVTVATDPGTGTTTTVTEAVTKDAEGATTGSTTETETVSTDPATGDTTTTTTTVIKDETGATTGSVTETETVSTDPATGDTTTTTETVTKDETGATTETVTETETKDDQGNVTETVTETVTTPDPEDENLTVTVTRTVTETSSTNAAQVKTTVWTIVTVTATTNNITGITTTETDTENTFWRMCLICGKEGAWELAVCPDADLACPDCGENIHGVTDHICPGVPEDPTQADPGQDPPEAGDPDPTPLPEIAKFYFSRVNQQAITRPVGTTYVVDLPMSVYTASTTGTWMGDTTIYLHCVPDEVTSGATYAPAVTSATVQSFTTPAPPLQLFGRSLYPNLTSSAGDDTWDSDDEFLLIISTDPDTADALTEVDNCCDGAGCRYHLRVKFSETAKPGR